MEWTDESITRLRSLWQEGLSTAEIGRRMQITKNAVVGKAHRLTLPARPSPIRKSLEPGGVPSRRSLAEARPRTSPTLAVPQISVDVASTSASPTIPNLQRQNDNVQPLRPTPARIAPRERVAAEDAPAVLALRAVATPPRRRGLTCCWPLGEPGTKEFHFCGGDPATGKPYCSEHAALAYVKLRDRRDSVA